MGSADTSYELGSDAAGLGRPSDADRVGATLLQMIWGIHISRCAYAVAELGIAGVIEGFAA